MYQARERGSETPGPRPPLVPLASAETPSIPSIYGRMGHSSTPLALPTKPPQGSRSLADFHTALGHSGYSSACFTCLTGWKDIRESRTLRKSEMDFHSGWGTSWDGIKGGSEYRKDFCLPLHTPPPRCSHRCPKPGKRSLWGLKVKQGKWQDSLWSQTG